MVAGGLASFFQNRARVLLRHTLQDKHPKDKCNDNIAKNKGNDYNNYFIYGTSRSLSNEECSKTLQTFHSADKRLRAPYKI